ncbi:MAG TPA: malto-oligosyltrehalose synthase [Burkholderiales bacterium]|nr:malto-oligosyltrehalose synthase [Burkholderiales bacterium]
MTDEVLGSYLDVFGNEKTIDPDTRQALERALGKPRSARRRAHPAPGRCYEPEILARGGRLWGFGVQLYGVRSARNWGIGDFGDLRALLALSARHGASLVGVNPLHAGDGASPYSPSSRHALNWRYLDLEAIPEYAASGKARALVASSAFQRRLKALREAELVDHEGVRRAKAQVLELLFEESSFNSASLPKGARTYALFEALREKFGAPWQSWPQPYRDPGSKEISSFRQSHSKRIRFHEYVQFQARRQLDAVQAHAKELGMPIGLYVDLALGADAGGAEVWADQQAYALDVSCGAPPDEFNPRGQDWGLPPFSPRALRASGCAPFAEMLRANMPEGGALRLDHVMALMRLYWIPRGAKPERGGYVSYPFRDLIAVLARESRRRRCLVVGEDLGTVPRALRSALNEAGVLSYRPLLFEKGADGEYCPPAAYPREALVCAGTHDLPTWRGFWAGTDIELRAALGLAVDPGREKERREADKAALARALAREGLDRTATAAHAFISRTPCKIALVQPEDVFELLEQANLPGSVEQHPNWRRKQPIELEGWDADRRAATLYETMQERSPKRALLAPAHAPVATYRLQLHRGFRFADAEALVPYLARLGVSHVYASPFLKARPGSMHGYDVVDARSINPEIGTEAGLERLLRKLKAHGMGMVLDVVPNHMGVLHADNPWWQDVLEKGRASRYAKFFDIDWTPGKVLLPVLGSHYGEALEKGEIRLVKEGGVWRVASDEINYRRFFEIAELAAVRVEDPEVFEEINVLVKKIVRHPAVHGVRVDHPDGLADPARYLERLNALFERPPWVLVEKILADHEKFPEDWAAHGTTGYRFANLLTGLFVDASAEARFDRVYQRFTGERRTFEEIGHASRLLIMSTTLAAELDLLAGRLSGIADGNRGTRDYTRSGLRKALAEIAARFPVYRSYVGPRGASDTDRRYIGWAVSAARRSSRIADPGVFDFVESVLTLDAAPAAGPRRAEMLAFAMRFQQFTAPVVAKGDEDTAFYRYHRLIALNEVGGNPARFGLSLKAFHAASEDRARRWPYTMLGTSTHDTKRSEDSRARLAVLSELPGQWRLALRRWSLLNRSRRSEIGGALAPSRGDEYHFYQALIAVWPGGPSAELRERLKAYMLKAVREAKQHSSWINPDLEYEAALERFVVESLQNELFLKDLKEVMPRLVHLGMLAGLSQALLKVASPGVPDYYQGSEVWDLALVDPDNRRPVDFDSREKLLRGKGNLLRNLADGRAKLHVIQRGLEVRKNFPHLFHGARYAPLHADGGMEEKVCAFLLRAHNDIVVAIAPRLFASLMSESDLAPAGEKIWRESRLVLPQGDYTDVLTGARIAGGERPMKEILADFPVALLVSRLLLS